MSTATHRSRLRPSDRRKQILDIAQLQFSERGFERVSIVDVANAAGVTRALVQHYFGGKRELYVAVVRRIVETASDVPIAVRDDGEPLEVRIAGTVDAWMSFVEDQGQSLLMATPWGTAIMDPEVQGIFENTREIYLTRMLQAYDDVVDDTPTTRFVVRAFLFSNEAICRQWLVGEATRDQVSVLLGELLRHTLERLAPIVDKPDARSPLPAGRRDDHLPAPPEHRSLA